MRLKLLTISLAVYLLGFALLLWAVLHANLGHFEYVTDDAYIHMAVAKNFALYGVFGITRYGFTSSLSSILWPWLLVGWYKVAGVSLYASLILNALFALTLAASSFYLLPPRRAFLFSIAAAFLGSTLSLTFVGLEHNLHALTTVLLFALAIGVVRLDRRVEVPLLFVLAALNTGARYEGMAAVLVLSAYRLLKRDVVSALTILLGGLLPVVAYGLWSVSKGWYFLPTSVLTKAYRFNLTTPTGWADLLFLKAFRTSLKMPALYSLWLLSLLLLGTSLSRADGKPAVLLSLLVLTAHLYFGNVHWFYRYEAYAVILSLFSAIYALNTEALSRLWRQISTGGRLALSLFALLLTFPVLSRGLLAIVQVPGATHEMWRQDNQIAAFVKRYYDGRTVVLNDVGHVAFYTDARIIDLWGLATLETARMLLERRYTWENVSSFVRESGGEVAMLYGDVFAKRYFPILWEEVGMWHLLGGPRLIVGSKNVYFYAITEDSDLLRRRFEEFSREELPGDVYWEVLTPSP